MTGISYSLIVLRVGLPHLFNISYSNTPTPGAGGGGISPSSMRGMADGAIPMRVKATHEEDYVVDTDGVAESGFSADLSLKSGGDRAHEWA
jgi:hypothetical protein